MKTDSGLHPNILLIRNKLTQGRERLRAQHDAGSPGIQVCTRMADLNDTLILEIYENAIKELGQRGKELEGNIALVPHGGFGRRDVAPYSDVDLMLLHKQGFEEQVRPLAILLSQYIVDAGMTLGFSTRTPAQACSMALKDVKILTSLIESRFLTGSVRLFSKFFSKFKTDATRRADRLIEDISIARRSERSRFGETVYLLKPNVKRSRGTLREIQLCRWIGFVRHGESSPTTLMRMDLMSPDDRNLLRRAKEFLLRVRNELHFHSGKEQDILDRFEQVRIAEKFGYEASEAILPVEGLMRDYFKFTGEVRYRVSNFVATSRNKSFLSSFVGRLFAHKVGHDYLVGPVHITATKNGIAKLKTDLTEVLRLMKMTLLYDRRVDHDTWMEIRQAMISDKELPLSEVREEFLSLIGQPGRLGSILRRLHQLRVLERIIPSMSHARCLLQFNEYHKYTVDEHSIRTVENVTDAIHDPGPLGDAYRSLRDKRVLHLAALVHDLGKGFTEDHSEVGARLALETAELLGLDSRETETLRFLVYRHLLMSHLAQRRDINDPQVVFQFAAEVGSPNVLKMLYILTCADIGAVGPGTLNDWKMELLTELYHRTMRQISDDSPSMSQKAQLQRRRECLLEKLDPDVQDDNWWQEQIAAMPPNCLYYRDTDLLLKQIGELKKLEEGNAIAWGRFNSEGNVTEYTVGTHESITPGLFSTLTGAISSKRMQIFSADINTLAGGLVLDRFYVNDLNQEGEPSQERIDDVTRSLVEALRFPAENRPSFKKKWGDREPDEGESLPRMPTQVKIDNATSEMHTIIDIFTNNRIGLLYSITRALFELDLSVSLAKIGTHLDQVVDVFYVTDLDGNTVESESKLEQVRQELLKAIDQQE
ncbi:MAG: [protein-PII] uridylyltransferase [Pirellulaceae bacterium]|jgi:[protein-PII] uridylyltransferase